MKSQLPHKLAAAIAAIVGTCSSAEALTLIYETGPNTGQPFNFSAGNPIIFKFTGFATGETYAGATAGFGVGGGAANVQAGIGAVDLLPNPLGVTSPSNVQTVINGVATGNVGPEDAWAIARVTTITDQFGETIWTQAGKGSQITALTAGGKDFYTSFDASTLVQTTSQVGVRLDLYEVTTAGFPNASTFTSLLGPAPGHGGDTLGNGSLYPGTTNGVPILSLRSAAGFIRPDGTLGGLATEFESSLNFSGSGGNGNLSQSFFDVIGGSLASTFNTNQIASNVPGGRALNTDIKAEFTQTTFGSTGGVPNTQNGWVAAINDPITAYPIPEPGTALFGLGCMLPFLASRRRKKTHVRSADLHVESLL